MNFQKTSKQKGFTLIELIIVIIILGILAVTAAPKFLDIQTDAQISAMNGIEGALRSASQIAHSAALIDSDGTISLEGGNYTTVDGYLTAAGVCQAIGLTNTSLSVGSNASSDGGYVCWLRTDGGSDGEEVAYIYPDSFTDPADGSSAPPGDCFISYTDANNATGQGTAADTVTAPIIASTVTCVTAG